MKIGIVGQGYVGTAVRAVFQKHYEFMNDLNLGETWQKVIF